MEFDESALQEVRKGRLLIDRYDAWLFELIKPFIGQRVLEVGCGLGNLTRHFLDRQLIVSIDTSENSVEHVNRIYSHHTNVRAVKCDVTSPDLLNLRPHWFDTAVSFNVLEHIEDDVLALEQIFRVLVPRGRLVLIVPAHMSLYGTMDRSIGHFRRYTRQDLGDKLHKVGFELIRQRYLNPIGGLGWFTNSRILRRKVPPAGQLKLFNRIMPLVTALESRLEMPFGVSLLSISERVS